MTVYPDDLERGYKVSPTFTGIVSTPLEDAARAYVAARLANDAAEPKDWSAAMIRVDDAWHDLLEASGLAMPEESAR